MFYVFFNGVIFVVQKGFFFFITSCDRYYKVRWIYYKLRQVLQSAMIITNCDSTGINPYIIVV